jgi:putative ABC transport system permease protein
MLQDLRDALRTLRSHTGYAVIAIAALALGIGANTAVFSIVHGVLFRPLPYPAPDRIVQIWHDLRLRGGPAREWASPPNFFEWQAQSDVFSSVAAVAGWGPSLTGAGREPERLTGARVSAGYFDVLGVPVAKGRLFTPDEDRPDGPPVVVLSYSLWQRLGGQDDLLGQSLALGGSPYTVVGVMPPSFRPAVITDAEVFGPLQLDPASQARNFVTLRVVGRLRPGVSRDEAQAKLDVLARRLETEYPASDKDARIVLVSLHEQLAGPFRRALLVLMGAVAFVLLIACANVANLMLARASARGRELAVRAALGAGVWRLSRQLVTEALVLSFAGGAAGALLAAWTVDALVATSPLGTAGFGDLSIDPQVLAFTAMLSLATGLVFGLAPASRAVKTDLTLALKDGLRGGTSGGRLRAALVVSEIAVALMLLVGAGLLLRSFAQLLAVDPGYRTDHVLTVPLNAPPTRYAERPQIAAFYDRVLARTGTLPGVRRAALVSVLPLSPGDNDADFSIEGRPTPQNDFDRPVAWYRMASAGYFDAMGIRIVRGRGFTGADGPDAPGVVVINESLARRYWPGEDPVGRRIRLGGGPTAPLVTIVGVAGDVLQRGLDVPPQAEMFIPYRQIPSRFMTLVLWTAVEPSNEISPVRDAVRAIDPELPLTGIATMADLRQQSVSQPRFLLGLLGAFAVAALVLAAIGIYGVVSYGVTQRTTEIGIRMALGADLRRVLWLVVWSGLRLTATGLAFGLAGAAITTRTLATLLFQVEATDPITFSATAAALGSVAVLASLVPALRATRVDPIRALRAQ